MNLLWLIPFCIASYLIGNFNFSIFLSKRKFKTDIRAQASGNPGATNMLRTFGAKVGLFIFFLDMLKGLVPSIVGFFVFGQGVDGYIALYSMGFSAVLGHCYPVFYRFKGGKGVSTIVGVLIVANPLMVVIACTVALVYMYIWHYMAVASFIVVTTVIGFQLFYHNDTSLAISILLVCFYFFILFKHRKNIIRLLQGKENKASLFKKKKKETISPEPSEESSEITQ
ncbi:MAG: glycerol-3-phosphate 1-O-acyltransferase PlsY [Firmicutes bacterium]|nr:glycerol-3-phosphate 1-O-acyltransferase PlsY [Bacillota bacterium]